MNPLSINLRPLLAGALTALAIGAAGGWTFNGWRLGQEIERINSDQARAELSAALDAGIRTAELVKQVEDARNDAVKREQALRRDAAGARQSADGLRDELAEFRRRLPELAADACRVRADVLADVFGQCAAEYRSLAEATDRLASDRQTLIEAWPY